MEESSADMLRVARVSRKRRKKKNRLSDREGDEQRNSGWKRLTFT